MAPVSWFSGVEGARYYRTNVLPGITQHIRGSWRLTAVETDHRSWTAVLTRTIAMLFIASLLILVLLPAALAASSR
jgi:hypothetical protein